MLHALAGLVAAPAAEAAPDVEVADVEALGRGALAFGAFEEGVHHEVGVSAWPG